MGVYGQIGAPTALLLGKDYRYLIDKVAPEPVGTHWRKAKHRNYVTLAKYNLELPEDDTTVSKYVGVFIIYCYSQKYIHIVQCWLQQKLQ